MAGTLIPLSLIFASNSNPSIPAIRMSRIASAKACSESDWTASSPELASKISWPSVSSVLRKLSRTFVSSSTIRIRLFMPSLHYWSLEDQNRTRSPSLTYFADRFFLRAKQSSLSQSRVQVPLLSSLRCPERGRSAQKFAIEILWGYRAHDREPKTGRSCLLGLLTKQHPRQALSTGLRST